MWMQAELEQLKQKLEKTEKERQELNLTVNRLETKVCQILLLFWNYFPYLFSQLSFQKLIWDWPAEMNVKELSTPHLLPDFIEGLV